MVSRRIVIVASGSLALVGALWFFAPKYRSWEERFHEIKVGMCEAEVVEVMGVEAGDYRTGTRGVAFWDAGFVWRPHPASAKFWSADENLVCVWFDANGIVLETRISCGIDLSDLTIIQKCLRWLRL